MKLLKLAGRIVVAAAAVLYIGTNVPAYAASNVIIAYEKSSTGPGEGWRQQADGSWNYQTNGELYKNCWQEINGKWYRFDESGKMLTGWQTIDGVQYYLTETEDSSHPLGSRYTSEQTPDGNKVDADGKLIPKEEPKPTVTAQQAALESASTRVNPYGNVNCVEISLTDQVVYAYKGTQCVFASPCVTGRVINGNATPAGNFKIYNKERNRTLRGTNADGSKYASPVSFWMPFNGGIGLHDATWRTNFNADVYYNYGSHGCINMPYDKAAALYDIIYVGMPVYVHN